jgi:aryl-alcohol dehydrogenase-like predicted oxidoreductase
MRTHRLGRSTVEVTELGFGGGPLGGLFEPLDDDTASVEDSLTRMGVDRIDVLYLHDAEEHFETALREATRHWPSCAPRAWSARACTTPAS